MESDPELERYAYQLPLGHPLNGISGVKKWLFNYAWYINCSQFCPEWFADKSVSPKASVIREIIRRLLQHIGTDAVQEANGEWYSQMSYRKEEEWRP